MFLRQIQARSSRRVCSVLSLNLIRLYQKNTSFEVFFIFSYQSELFSRSLRESKSFFHVADTHKSAVALCHLSVFEPDECRDRTDTK